MKTIRTLLVASLTIIIMAGVALPMQAAQKIRVLVVTGGHGFEKEPFFQMFKDDPNITFKAVAHPNAHALLEAEAAKQWDVMVMYDMWQKIDEAAKENFLARLKDGKGLVALHHCMASYQAWPEYRKIIGGKYYLKKATVDGEEKSASTYKHDVRFRVKVADKAHPVTKGVNDFDILDETYGSFEVLPAMHVLLTTDHPTSSPKVGWAQSYGNARVVTLQLGHDHHSFEDENFRRLLSQAIQWTAMRN